MSKPKEHGTTHGDELKSGGHSPGDGGDAPEVREAVPGSEIPGESGEEIHHERRMKDRRKQEQDVMNEAIQELKKEIGGRDEEIQKLKGEIESMKDKSLRQLAEFDNFKKRNQKQQEYYKKFAIKDFALDIIVINDDLLRVLDASSSIREGESFEQAHNSFVEGVSMISRRLESSLGKYGIVEVEAQGQAFNPNFHEAVEIEESPGFSCDTVTKVHQKGFRIEELVLRPAKVKVSKPPRANTGGGCPEPPKNGDAGTDFI